MASKKLFFLFSILFSMVGTKALAYDIAVENADGVTIYYNYINNGKELEVMRYTGNSYRGDVVIPEEVTYMEQTRKVTSIGVGGFSACGGLTSVTIPNSVINIGVQAFYDCSRLTSITIPSSVISIGKQSFCKCNSLCSITVDEKNQAYRSVDGVLLSKDETKIFSYPAGKKETDYIIPNTVICIEESAFQDCKRLTSIIIPNSVTTIGGSAFQNCNSLTSITIPTNMTAIGAHAFDGCNLSNVISKIENPFKIETNTFSDNTFYNATLYVPEGTIDKYKATEGWKKFSSIKEEGNNPPEPPKCEKPTISYQNGKLTFHSATEGTVCHSTIKDADITSYNTNEVQLGVTYNISVYATKEGYDNSETATATLCWIDVEPKTEGIDNGIAQVRANAVMIKADGGIITVEGADDNTIISVYTLDGVLAGSAISKNGVALVNTNITSNSCTIVKIGDKSVKVFMK